MLIGRWKKFFKESLGLEKINIKNIGKQLVGKCNKKHPVLGCTKNECCCNCANQFVITGHPWHTDTSISTVHFYGCYALGKIDNVQAIEISAKHGICECWQEISKEYIKSQKENNK